MRTTSREMRRAPVRIIASILAIALAIAAIGVFAVPGVAESSLRESAAGDRLTHVSLTTSSFDDPAIVASIREIEGIEAAEARITTTAELRGGSMLNLIGRSRLDEINKVRLDAGHEPTSTGEIVVDESVGLTGDVVRLADGTGLEVVGTGQTTFWADQSNTVFTTLATAREVSASDGFNRIMVRLDDPTASNLDETVAVIRRLLAGHDITLTTFPVTLPDGAHPIEEDLTQISFMIGSLGVVSGIVALVLLAATANSIVTQRTRDAAVMRALGGTSRAVRRDLRRLAVATGVLGTLIGIPLGVVVANLIARIVLQRFAGITPSIAVDPVVIVASVIFGVLGARLVSGRVARRVARAPLASALRDRDASPFGHRLSDRLIARLPTGGLLERIALRAVVRRKGRSVAVIAQYAGAVAAAVAVASLGASIADFNAAELASYRWETETQPADPVYPFPLAASTDDGFETAVRADGEIDGWELEVVGVTPASEMIDTTVAAGRWLSPADRRQAVLAERFATQEGHSIGDTLTVELATGPADYGIVGLHPIRSVAMFVPATELAADLGADGFGNTLWGADDATPPVSTDAVTVTTARERLFAEDVAARDAVVAVFAAIGAIVVTIAALGASSTVAMNLYERRGELATLQATGARRRDVVAVVALELGSLAVIGWTIGVVAGIAGAWAIMDFFATANAIELGYTVSYAAVPVTAIATTALVLLLASSAGHAVQRRPPAVTLRAAT